MRNDVVSVAAHAQGACDQKVGIVDPNEGISLFAFSCANSLMVRQKGGGGVVVMRSVNTTGVAQYVDVKCGSPFGARTMNTQFLGFAFVNASVLPRIHSVWAK